MGLFSRTKETPPQFPPEQYEPVLRCSICTGEQTLCLKDRETGDQHELMLIRSFSDLEEVCSANGIDPETVRKIY